MPRIAQEINFWSGIMRDHGEFLLMTLSSREQQLVMTSQNFKNVFIQIHSESEELINNPNEEKEIELVRRTLPVIIDFINYKMMLLKRLLECNIQLNLTPTFINHMINEATEFYRTLSMIQTTVPINNVQENIFLHTIWLPDAAGHAASIAAELDPTEAIYIKQADTFKELFNNLFIKSSELEKMLPRANLDDGSLTLLNEESIQSIKSFIEFLNIIKELRSKCKVMGSLDPIMPDHMIREEEYYMSKILNFME